MKYIFSLILLSVITVFALVAAQFIGMGLIALVYDIPLQEFINKMQNINQHPELRTPILILQGFTQIFSFLAVALFFVKYIYRFNPVNLDNETDQAVEEPFLQRYKTPSFIFLVVIVLAVVAFPAVWVTGALNGAVEFPEALKWLENWMREQEDNAQTLTLFMTNFSSIQQTILGFIVIAILAGLTEEVFFRGVVQPLFQNLTQNKHIAIWITAIIFSAIHFQFYGFVPRMLLGALFGYLYIYTNNIFVPIWAHILNNGLTLVLFLFIDKEMLNAPKMEGADFVTMTPLGILSLLLCIGLLRFIKKKMEKKVKKN